MIRKIKVYLGYVGKLIKMKKEGAQDVRPMSRPKRRMRFQRDESFFASFFLRLERKKIYLNFLIKKPLPTVFNKKIY